MTTDKEYSEQYWRYADRQQENLLSYIYDEQENLSDEVQSILDKFKNIELSGKLNKCQVEQLHRKIKKWKADGYTDYQEMKLYLQDLGNRTRITGNEALFLYLFAALMGSYKRIIKRDITVLTSIASHVYQLAFREAYSITKRGTAREIKRKFVERTLEGPLPNGGNYYDDLYNDARYRASQLTKQTASAILQGQPLDVENTGFQKIMDGARRWQLRAVERTPTGGFAGYYDMIMSFVVGQTVVEAFMDADVTTYRFIATIDNRTTDECRGLHGKVFSMSEIKIGINAPPVYPPPHPCRSVIRPER